MDLVLSVRRMGETQGETRVVEVELDPVLLLVSHPDSVLGALAKRNRVGTARAGETATGEPLS
nr:hypothetical protein GCM10020241_61440 [Streptoalloteichus tenebrarius]